MPITNILTHAGMGRWCRTFLSESLWPFWSCFVCLFVCMKALLTITLPGCSVWKVQAIAWQPYMVTRLVSSAREENGQGTSLKYSPGFDCQPHITHPETQGGRIGKRLHNKKIKWYLQPLCSSTISNTLRVGNAQQYYWEVLVHWNSPSVFWYELTMFRRMRTKKFCLLILNFCEENMWGNLLIKFPLWTIWVSAFLAFHFITS